MRYFIPLAGLVLLVTPLSLPGQAPYPPGYGPDQLVREWYGRFLNRAPDPQAAGWIDSLRAGQPPEAVLSQILGSSEYYTRAGSTPEGFVRRLHTDLTGRPPGPGETAAWVRQLYGSDRQDVAYQMLHRYPQNWGGSSAPDYGGAPTYNYRRPSWRHYYPR